MRPAEVLPGAKVVPARLDQPHEPFSRIWFVTVAECSISADEPPSR